MIVDGREVAQATLARWVIVHTVVVGLALAWRRGSRGATSARGEDAELVAPGVGGPGTEAG